MLNKQTKYMRIWRNKNPNYYKTPKWKKYYREWMKKKRNQDKSFHDNELIKHNLWKKVNRNKIKTYKRIYENNRKRKDVSYKLKCYLRSRLSNVVKKNKKSNTIIKLLGCSIGKLKLHLQNQFKINMTWKNYGKWHIDHIKPCAKFDLSKASEQRKCFHYTNLQPLWAKENISKGKKYVL